MPTPTFEDRLAQAWPPEAWYDTTTLMAVSGGADSVAMLRAMAALKRRAGGPGRLVAAHFNHRLRGTDADADASFVVNLCRALNLDCESGHGDPASLTAAGDGLEAAARNARYAFLEQTAARLGARYVATAHTADDQAETILHRIIRGTGISGLSGMPRVRPLGPAVVIRPLLGFHREELLAYLTQIQQDYRTDKTNADPRFTRNRIRHDLLPRLERDYHPGAAGALLRLGALAGEAQAVIDSLVDALADRCVRDAAADAVLIDASALAGQSRYLVRELLVAVWRRQQWPMQAMGFAEWEQLAEMLETSALAPKPVRQVLPGDILAERDSGNLRLTRRR